MTDPLARQADTLISAAQIHAVGALSPIASRFKVLQHLDTDHWDFIVTIAAVFVAAKRLSDLRLEGKRAEALLKILARRLSEWAPDGLVALEDCKRLYEHEFDRLTANGHDPEFVASDAVGIWAVWNLISREPKTEGEMALCRAIGVSVTTGFVGWWSE